MVTAYGREEVLKEAAGIGHPERAGQARERVAPVRQHHGRARRGAAGRAADRSVARRARPTTGWRRCAARASCWWRTTTSTSRWRANCWKTRAWSSRSPTTARSRSTWPAKRPYDLVFMDMQMPVMDGVTATREMRKLERLAQLPIVAMTANAMEQDRRKCMDAGMNDFLDQADRSAGHAGRSCCDGSGRAARQRWPRRPARRRRQPTRRRPRARTAVAQTASQGWTRRWA